ncbi:MULTISPECIES: hypothetical protein [Enterococcus]|uniref:hypothetical protein n=1 Tax=Enterococcus TaxID=1350 RepID=UPI000F50BAFD|nr:hypothetical protein [Enterococcus sp. FDAARGOS_553]AYY08857.1 hypothetical protein EGX73_02775 [Enterococcus sp. FDAARGOS_553]
MESTDYAYYGTSLIKVDFKKSLLKNNIDVRFGVSPKLNKKKDVYIKGKAEFVVDEEVKGLIAMQAVFKLNKQIDNEDMEFSDFDIEDQNYFIRPLLSEISLFISILSQKASRLPIILPIEEILENRKDLSES